MSEAVAHPAAEAPSGATYLPRDATYGSITRDIAAPVFAPAGWRWWTAFLVTLALTLVMIFAILWLFIEGVGIWGVNADVVWGFAITNYVWWIGIGNAGTLISSMLLLTRQRWRASINRFAEAMTLFAAAIAGLFPILHLGRPYLFYWLVPYPNVMSLWPQWRSPLVWDLFAIASYIIFSLLFWYTGLIPDLASLRDRAHTRFGQLVFGAFALGWRGSARQWRRFDAFYWAMAAMAVPLVISLHSVVGLDFAAGLMPGWQETIFPPYFVVGAMFSGFAMVVTLAVPIRWGLRLETFITPTHFDAVSNILLMGSIIMGASYATEWFLAWYAGNAAERLVTQFEFSGSYAPLYWLMLLFNVALPQLFWWRRTRRSLSAIFAIAILINVGMWLERLLIILNTLSHAYLPARWSDYGPTVWDWALLLGTLGFFTFLFVCFVRLVPAVSMHEVRQLAHAQAELEDDDAVLA
ncbi:MAG: polysulfide reductase NrfD [Methylobacteriaceae bacterium]|nr:polysulfide reductase NrfD [Methylobacteriaceae bacterium]